MLVAGGAAKYKQIQQRIGAKPIGAVDADARAFADRIQPFDDRVRIGPSGQLTGATTWPW